MRIFLIRHATREVPEDFSDAEEGDPEAELTDEGKAIAESLGSAQARLLHSRIAAALEELPDSLSRLDQIAHHWAQAEVIE